MWRKGNTLALLAGMQIDIATMGINMEISLKTRNKTTITCLVAQSCLILCNPMDYSLPASSVHRDSPGKNTEVGCHFLFQGIFPTQGSNQHLLCLLHWQVGSLPQESPGKLIKGKWKWKVAQSRLTLCNPMDYTVHGILQVRILEWVAFPFSRGSSQPRDRTQVSTLQADSLPAEPQGMPKSN